MAVKKTIAVFSPDDIYLSHCTWNKALKLMESHKAIRINAYSIRLVHSKRERIRRKHAIIAEENRICYICNRKIPKDELATIDHMIPKSRDARADTYENMKCCCERCNNDKDNMLLSEYVKHIYKHREKYSYITDKRLKYLKNFAHYYEQEFYDRINIHTKDIKQKFKNNHRKGSRR